MQLENCHHALYSVCVQCITYMQAVVRYLNMYIVQCRLRTTGRALQHVRTIFPGSSVIHEKAPKLNGWKIIREMLRHVWPRDRPWHKVRVVTALGLLVGAKASTSI